MTADRIDVDAELDRIYQLPLEQFVHARDELAARVRAESGAATALPVHAIAKPTLSAWAVNQLYWRSRTDFDALADAGRRLRAAQAAKLAGQRVQLREARQARDAALRVALERTLELLRQGGHPVTPAMRLRVATNLDALGAYGGSPPGTRPGRLIEDLEPPGFDVFAGMAVAPPAGAAPAPPPERAPAKVVSFEAIARARREVTEAEHLAAERRAEAQRARTALADAQRAAKAAQAEADLARRAWETAVARAAEAERGVPEREREVTGAQQAALEAEQRLERARAALEAVRKPRRKP